MTTLFGSCVEILPTARTGSDPADNYWRTLEGIVPQGFAVELWPTNVSWRHYTPRHLSLLRRACEAAPRISIHGVMPRWNLEGLRRELDVCNAVGATLLLLHSSALGLAGPIRVDAAAILSFIREARRRGIIIALENCPEPPDAFGAMVREVNAAGEDANLAVCLDVGHTVFITGNPQGTAEYLSRLPPKAVCNIYTSMTSKTAGTTGFRARAPWTGATCSEPCKRPITAASFSLNSTTPRNRSR